MTTTPYARPAYRNYVLFLLMLVYALTTIDRGIIMALIEPIKHELALSDTQAAILIGPAFAIFFVLAGIPLGRLADRGVRRTVVAACLFAWSAMTALCGVAQNFLHLFIGRSGVGIGEAGGPPAAVAMIADVFPPQRRASASSFFYAGGSLGMLVSFAAGGWIAAHHGWRMAFVAAALPGILLALLIFLSVREPPRGLSEGLEDTQTHRSLAQTLRFMRSQSSLIQLVMGATLAQTVGAGAVSFFMSYMIRSHGMSLSEAGLAISLGYGIASGVGMIAFAALADRLGHFNVAWRCRIPAITVLIAIFALAGTALAASRQGMMVGLVLWSFFCTGYTASTYALFQSLVKVNMRATMGSIQFIVLAVVGGSVGPMVVGMASDRLAPTLGNESLRYALLVLTVFYAWAAMHFRIAERTLRKDLTAALTA